MIVSYFRRRTDSHATRRSTTWTRFCAVADRPREWPGDKLALPMYAPAAFKGDHRAKDDIEAVYATSHDLDAEPLIAPAKVAEMLRGTAASIHTSFRHTIERPRGRLHMFLSRPIETADDYSDVWAFTTEVLAEHGIPVGIEAKDGSRASFIPSHAPGAPYEHHTVDGVPLDVDTILATMRERHAAEAREREERRRYYEQRAKKRGEDPDAQLLARAVAEVAASSARHSTLNRWTYTVATKTHLPGDVIAQAMQDAGMGTGLSRREVERTIKGALRSARRTAA